MSGRPDPFRGAGLLLAPLATVPAAALHFAAWNWDLSAAWGAVYAALVILPLSYSLALLVGLPYLYWLNRLGLLNFAFAFGGATLVGLLTGLAIGVSLFPTWDVYGRLFYVSLGGVCGMAVGLTYPLIRRRTPAYANPHP